MRFDELNRLKKDYFEPMAIKAEDKERRRELCDYLTDAFLYFFSVYEVHRMYDSMLTQALYEQLLVDRISDAVSKVTGIDSFMSMHIRDLAKEVVETTIKHVRQTSTSNTTLHDDDNSLTALEYESEESLDSLNQNTSGSRFQDEDLEDEEEDIEDMMKQEAVEEYWLSIHRAENIAQNESNTFMNYSDFLDAKERGYTKKTWLTMLDDKVRDTHEDVEGQTVGIDEFFHVGGSEMRFPHDWEQSPDPKEVINCRCAVDYK